MQWAAHQSRPILGEKWKFKFTWSLHSPLYQITMMNLATVGQQISFDKIEVDSIHTRIEIEFKISDKKSSRLKLLMGIECKYRTAIGY